MVSGLEGWPTTSASYKMSRFSTQAYVRTPKYVARSARHGQPFPSSLRKCWSKDNFSLTQRFLCPSFRVFFTLFTVQTPMSRTGDVSMANLLTRQSLPTTKDGFAHAVRFTVALLPLAQFLRSGA